MPYTGQLGTELSAPGNLLLGSIGLNLDQFFGDMLTLDDELIGGLLVNDIGDELEFDEQWVVAGDFNVTLDDTLTFTDEFTWPLTDDLDFTDEMVAASSLLRSASDSLSMSDVFATEITGSVFMIDGLNFTEAFARSVDWYRLAPDTLTYTDVMDGYISRDAEDTLTYTDDMEGERSYGINDLLDLGETWTVSSTLKRNMASVLEPYDNLTVTTYLRISFGDSLSLSDVMSGNKNRPLVPDTLVFTDTMSGVQSKKLTDTVTYTDVASVTKSVAVTFVDTLPLVDAFRPSLTVTTSFSDINTFVDTLTGQRVAFGTFSDTMSYTDSLYRDIHAEVFDSTLDYTEVWVVEKTGVGVMQDVLPLVDAMPVATTLNKSFEDIVQYDDDFYIYLDGAGVTIRGATLTIVLPAPEFNDFEAGQSKMIVGRSMDGNFRTYVKKTDREKLNWRFLMPKPKADELKAFLLAEIDNQLIVDDFKGRRWSFKLLSNSFDFTQTGRWAPCGDKTEVTLEFEGVRYYG